MAVFYTMSKKISFLKEIENKTLDGALFLLYIQPPLLIEFWSNIGIWSLIILIVANTGTAYYMKQNSDNNTGIGLITLTILYLYLIGLWFIPLICFQFVFLFLIFALDVNVFKTNYLK
jgi:hypothetical protein